MRNKQKNPSPGGMIRNVCFGSIVKGVRLISWRETHANSTPDTIFGVPKTGLPNYFAQLARWVGLSGKDEYHHYSYNDQVDNRQREAAHKAARRFHVGLLPSYFFILAACEV